MTFKVTPHFILKKTHLIIGSSNIIFGENLAKKQLFSGEETDFLIGISSIYN